VFFGRPVPYGLRLAGDHFTFVGECYVDGVMHGEALTAPREGIDVAQNAEKGALEVYVFKIR
jgi:hypothetical protein